MQRFYLLLFYLLAPVALLYAQSVSPEVLSTAGASGSTSDATISWTLGQTAVQTLTTDDAILTQGFHQPLIRVQRYDKIQTDDLSFKVYPNPTSEFLRIEMPTYEGYRQLTLLDSESRDLRTATVESESIEFSVADLPAGIYYLRIGSDEQIFATYEIIKL